MIKTAPSLAFFAFAAAFGCSTCPAQTPLPLGQVTTDSLSPATGVDDDGPHIYWESDTSAVVFYLCDGEFIEERHRVTDSLCFSGLCRDSDLEYTISAPPSEVAPSVFDNIPRILAVSDIHGEYEYFVDILQKGGVIDSGLDWIWSSGHLVILGDVFGRGDRVTESLWLIYRLERQARRHGGRLHFVLGNHELMVLRGDNRYVHEKYLNGIVRKTRIRH
ncbi:MAG: metallophosphoesterase, partial [candidate division Zixibacteria bacterium]|nr:metallophosphoesterase [candidate division Zixibacteria bacterium]